MIRNAQPDEFYVGYLPRAPRGLARAVLRTVAALSALAVVIALLLVFGQQPFAKAAFEFRQYRDFAGVLEKDPYPALLVPRPDAVAGAVPYSRYLLVAAGKHGAESEVARASGGRSVRLRGSLIYRDGHTMVELVPGSLTQENPDTVLRAAQQPLGEVTLAGEIVDSKCYLGVMNPGRTKVHRDCAARCISGGIPPMLVTTDAIYLLAGADGRKLNREVLDVVGEAVEVHGTAALSGETLILRAEPASFRRITARTAGR